MRPTHNDGTEVDLQIVATPDTPIAEHQIFLNAVKCPDCRQVLISMSTHDFRTCECENEVHVDGGRSYLKRGWANNLPIELSIMFSPDDEGYFYNVGDERK